MCRRPIGAPKVMYVNQCVLYRIIELDQDQNCLQLIWSLCGHSLVKCCLMSINVWQWGVIDITTKLFYSFFDSEPLNCVTEHSYLSVLLTLSTSFSPLSIILFLKHLIYYKVLNFIQQYLSKYSEEVNILLTLVWSAQF